MTVRTPLLAATLLVGRYNERGGCTFTQDGRYELPARLDKEGAFFTNPAVDERGARYDATLRFVADPGGVWRVSLD